MPSFALPDAFANLPHPLGTRVLARGDSVPRCPSPGDTPVPKSLLRTTPGQVCRWGKCGFFSPLYFQNPNVSLGSAHSWGICRSPRGNREIFSPAALSAGCSGW